MNQLSEDFKLYYNRAWLWDIEHGDDRFKVLFHEQEPWLIDLVVCFSFSFV